MQFALILSMPIFFYLLISPQQPITPKMDFNIIMLSATLGGLVLAGALFRGSSQQIRGRLIGVARKFIFATALFLIFTFFIFLVELLGGIDLNSFEPSIINAVRCFSFWIAAIGFYVGVFVFAIALIDLLLTLRYIGLIKD